MSESEYEESSESGDSESLRPPSRKRARLTLDNIDQLSKDSESEI